MSRRQLAMLVALVEEIGAVAVGGLALVLGGVRARRGREVATDSLAP